MPDNSDILGLATHVRRYNPEVIATQSREHNEHCIYAYRERLRLPYSSFVVEARVDCIKTSSGIECTSSVLTSSGAVVATFPKLVIDNSVHLTQMRTTMNKWVLSLVAYYATTARSIAERLERGF
jgi:hypothetical protein